MILKLNEHDLKQAAIEYAKKLLTYHHDEYNYTATIQWFGKTAEVELVKKEKK